MGRRYSTMKGAIAGMKIVQKYHPAQYEIVVNGVKDYRVKRVKDVKK